MGFPSDFAWGAATAAYQIEGAASAEGKGDSVWDMLCRAEGRIFRDETGEVACDHHRLMSRDVELMSRMGLKAYRFSVSWPRVMPEGVGRVNEAGLGFYERLVDRLLEAGVTPWVTLFHWDFPLALYYRGGWLNAESVHWFGEYAAKLVERLSDRVEHWLTLNEPQVFVGAGHQVGNHAPGLVLSDEQVLRVGHHVLLAHGEAVRRMRAAASRPIRIGYAPVGVVWIPETESQADVEAARTKTFEVPDHWFNAAWWIDPVMLGQYPADGLARHRGKMRGLEVDDLSAIAEPVDLLGFNNYHARVARMGPDGPEAVPPKPGAAMTTMGWPVTDSSLYWACRFFHERYGKPMAITENGVSTTDWVDLDGRVRDGQRIDFLRRYLLGLERAVSEGLPVEAYFQWSLMDNFEWAEGYSRRFGLIHVDFETLERTPKDSARWYAEVIASNGRRLHEPIG